MIVDVKGRTGGSLLAGAAQPEVIAAANLGGARLLLVAIPDAFEAGQIPRDWAMTQNGLSYTLGMLGKRESGTAHLEEAVAAYRAALEELTRDRAPLAWAPAS